MPLYLGVDCGGSSTRALVVDDEGKVVFEGSGGPANLASTPEQTLATSLDDALQRCPLPSSVVGCFAGLLGEELAQRARSLLSSRFGGVPVGVWADYVAALAAAPEGSEVVVVAGTGSVVCSWKDGAPFKTGGGGPLLGDDGSAFDVVRSHVGRLLRIGAPRVSSGSTAAWALATFGSDDLDEVVPAVYRHPTPAQALASGARAVAEDAERGDTGAMASASEAMGRLALAVDGHLAQVAFDGSQAQVALFGGLWEASDIFVRLVEQSLASLRAPGVPMNTSGTLSETQENTGPRKGRPRQYHVVRAVSPPVLGAARLAQRLFHGNGI